MKLLTLLTGFIFLAVALPTQATAHKPSDSYLTLTVTDDRVEGRWDIALRDLDHAIGLDRDGDGALTWGEVKDRHRNIASYALARLAITTPSGACTIQAKPQLFETHSDGGYTVLPFGADCPGSRDDLSLRYRLFFDLDPLHRGLLQIRKNGAVATAVLSPDAPVFRWHGTEKGWLGNFVSFIREGVWHILIGFDHILFLTCLLLPAGLRRESGAWRRVADWRDAAGPVFRTVTAFTIAHSITLAVAALGLVVLPSWLVESVIAGSIIVAALNNIWPVVMRRLWILAFAFGLIHGFGFASVLADLGLPQTALVASLLGFNLGVEIGQLAIVAITLPPIYALRHLGLYPRLILPAGSTITAIVAAVWLVERAFQVAIV